MLCDSWYTTFVYSLCVMSLMWSGCPRPMVYPFLIYSLYIVCLMICVARRCLVPPPPRRWYILFWYRYSLLARKRVCCRPPRRPRPACVPCPDSRDHVSMSPTREQDGGPCVSRRFDVLATRLRWRDANTTRLRRCETQYDLRLHTNC